MVVSSPNASNIHSNTVSSNESPTNRVYFAERVCHASILIVISVLVIVGNALVIAVVRLDRHLHKPTFFFLVNLAAADLLVGVLYAPFYAAAVIEADWVWGMAWCNGHAFLISTSVNASLLTLCLVSIDRFVDITDPFSYLTKITPRITAGLILICWLHSLFWAAGPLFKWGDVMYDFYTSTCRPNWAADGLSARGYALGLAVFAFAIPVLIMVFCYFRIFMVANSHIKKIRKENQSFFVSKSSEIQIEADYQVPTELKAHKTILVIIGAFVVCWSLYTVSTLWKMLTGQATVPYRVANAGLTLALFNSVVNPVIYSLRDHRFRKGFIKVFLIILRKLDNGESKNRTSSRIREILERQQQNATAV